MVMLELELGLKSKLKPKLKQKMVAFLCLLEVACLPYWRRISMRGDCRLLSMDCA